MQIRKKIIRAELCVFLFLLLISICRQLSLRLYPDSVLRPAFVFAGYSLILGMWIVSIRLRITQRHIRTMLLTESSLMAAGLTLRFVQDTFLLNSVFWLRFTGILLSATLIPILLLGCYTALGLGQGEDYRMPGGWLSLILPTTLITILIITDEQHHLIFRLLPTEVQPNISFHPNILFYLICIFGFGLIFLRSILIYRRRESLRGGSLLSFLHIGLLLGFSLPYIVSSFSKTPEIIEFFAGWYYLEGLSWEIYIILGRVPVNTDYAGVFEHSTVGMQMVDDRGLPILRSHSAKPVQGPILEQLRETGHAVVGEKEINLHPCTDSWLLWERDIHSLREVERKLGEANTELLEEGELLAEEMRIRNEETKVAAQNRIYSALCEEIAPQLILMQELVEKCRTQTDSRRYYQRLFIIGTYVKRRCNLRLIQNELGEIPVEDIRLAFGDMVRAMLQAGMEADMSGIYDPEVCDPDYCIEAYDILEETLETIHFQCSSFRLNMSNDRIEYRIRGTHVDAGSLERSGLHCVCRTDSQGEEICLTLEERRSENA